MTLNFSFPTLDNFLKLSAIDLRLLVALCRLSGDEAISISPQDRKQLLEDMGMKSAHLSNGIARLKQAGLITGSQGSYELNTPVLWRGHSRPNQVRTGSIEVTLTLK